MPVQKEYVKSAKFSSAYEIKKYSFYWDEWATDKLFIQKGTAAKSQAKTQQRETRQFYLAHTRTYARMHLHNLPNEQTKIKWYKNYFKVVVLICLTNL